MNIFNKAVLKSRILSCNESRLGTFSATFMLLILKYIVMVNHFARVAWVNLVSSWVYWCHLESTDVILSDLGMKNKGLNKLNRRMQICLETPITFLIKSHKKHMLTIFLQMMWYLKCLCCAMMVLCDNVTVLQPSRVWRTEDWRVHSFRVMIQYRNKTWSMITTSHWGLGQDLSCVLQNTQCAIKIPPTVILSCFKDRPKS